MIFLIGNKSDLEAQRDVTYEEAKQFADENGLYLNKYYWYQMYWNALYNVKIFIYIFILGLMFLECSAKT